MRKLFLFISLITLLGMISCKKDTNANESTSDSTSIAIDTAQSQKIVDPDPTDSIPAGQYGINSSNPKTAELVRLTLNNLYKEDLKKNFINDFGKKFIFFEYDLNEDGKKEILVGLRGPYFCGSGGCTQLLLDYEGNVITTFSVSGNPIIIDTNKTNGWKDLFIWSGGENRIVKFDGKTYPSNSSTLTELKLIPGDGLPRALDFKNEPYAWFSF